MQTTTILKTLSRESKSTDFSVTSAEIKEVLDNYAQEKQASCFSSPSSQIARLQSFYEGLSSPHLSTTQIVSLANLLHEIERNKETSPKTFRASEQLREKLKLFIKFSSHNWSKILIPEMIGRIMDNPDLFKNLNVLLKFTYYEENIVSIFINDPIMLSNILKARNKEYLNYYFRIEELILIHQALHDSSHFERMYDVVVNLKNMDDNIYRLVNSPDKRINKEYWSRVDSEENVKFICKFVRDADVLSDVFILLHQNVIGRSEQNRAEMLIRSVDEKAEGDVSKGFENLRRAFRILETNRLFIKNHADLICFMCAPKNRHFAENIANAMVELNRYDRLNTDNKNMIKQCHPGSVYAVSQTFNILKEAKLSDLENRVYVARDEIQEAVPCILKELNEAKPCLLSRENVNRVLELLPTNTPLLYAKLAKPITQEGFISALSEIKEYRVPVTSFSITTR